jgi:hypothetical protein
VVCSQSASHQMYGKTSGDYFLITLFAKSPPICRLYMAGLATLAWTACYNGPARNSIARRLSTGGASYAE